MAQHSTFTTADLPPSMQLRPESLISRAVRGSGLALAITCRHGVLNCDTCIVDAARRIVEAAQPPATDTPG